MAHLSHHLTQGILTTPILSAKVVHQVQPIQERTRSPKFTILDPSLLKPSRLGRVPAVVLQEEAGTSRCLTPEDASEAGDFDTGANSDESRAMLVRLADKALLSLCQRSGVDVGCTDDDNVQGRAIREGVLGR